MALVPVLPYGRLHHVRHLAELGVFAEDVDQHGGLRRGGGRRLPDHGRVPGHQLLKSLDQFMPENGILVHFHHFIKSFDAI